MPPKKTNVLKQMEARVEALESELSEVRSTLVDVQNTVKENHASLFALLEKCLGKTLHVGEGSTGKKYGDGGPGVTGEDEGYRWIVQ